MTSHFPILTERAACMDYPAEWWFPEEVSGRSRAWSHTPDATNARTICANCPAQQECRNYALAYSGLAGIWGGLDYQERRELQDRLGITPIFMTDTYKSTVFALLKDGKSDE